MMGLYCFSVGVKGQLTWSQKPVEKSSLSEIFYVK